MTKSAMSGVEEQLSGMAGEVRSSLTSEQFDLANYTEARVRDLVLSAFSSPLTSPTAMVRFTFVVGGGKLVRAKYSDDLPKWMGAALRDVGYAPDTSAAETFDSQGTNMTQKRVQLNPQYRDNVKCEHLRVCSNKFTFLTSMKVDLQVISDICSTNINNLPYFFMWLTKSQELLNSSMIQDKI